MKRLRLIILIVAAVCSIAATGQKTIVQEECWLDGKIAASQSMTGGTMSIDVSSFKPGLHTFTMRVQDSEGLWSSSVTRFFLMPVAPSEATIVRCMYWFDGDMQHAVTAPLEGNSGMISVDVDNLSRGEHTLSWMVGDDRGTWSEVTTVEFIAPGPLGDVNADDVVSVADVSLLIDYLLSGNAQGISLECADCNKNGDISISDVAALIDYLLSGMW